MAFATPDSLQPDYHLYVADFIERSMPLLTQYAVTSGRLALLSSGVLPQPDENLNMMVSGVQDSLGCLVEEGYVISLHLPDIKRPPVSILAVESLEVLSGSWLVATGTAVTPKKYVALGERLLSTPAVVEAIQWFQK